MTTKPEKIIEEIDEDRYILDANDIELMRTAIKLSYFPERNLALFEVMRSSGARCGEITAMRVMDVDLEKGRIYIHKPKKVVLWQRPRAPGGERPYKLLERRRISFIDGIAVEIVKKYLEIMTGLKPASYLFQMTSRNAEMIIEKAAILAFGNQMVIGKIKYKLITPHAFRHTRATELLAAGVPEAYIEKTMGWRPGSKTFRKIYQHASDDTIQQVMKEKMVLHKIDEHKAEEVVSSPSTEEE